MDFFLFKVQKLVEVLKSRNLVIHKHSSSCFFFFCVYKLIQPFSVRFIDISVIRTFVQSYLSPILLCVFFIAD